MPGKIKKENVKITRENKRWHHKYLYQTKGNMFMKSSKKIESKRCTRNVWTLSLWHVNVTANLPLSIQYFSSYKALTCIYIYIYKQLIWLKKKTNKRGPKAFNEARVDTSPEAAALVDLLRHRALRSRIFFIPFF